MNGDIYVPEFEFNGIGDLKHLEGYKIKLIQEVSYFDLCERVVFPEIEGCTDCNYPNFDVWATVDDGSCSPFKSEILLLEELSFILTSLLNMV